ncbi:FadR/GntR family transcriptional regulator [Pseudoclavibacter albus]|uniref:FadR/GntR family transcriptional regulator n=1 Tax=Pseudoclavibacter albus TaxID=272241 RepID=UPI0008264687|nr:FCD domain-containing protein [Pseudoclavibacter alba]
MVYNTFSPIGGRASTELIVQRLVGAVAAGQLRPGDRLPPEQELAQAFEVAPMTLRKGLEVLRDLGVVESRRGRAGGTFIGDEAPLRIQEYAESFSLTKRWLEDLTDYRIAISAQACALAAERASDDALAAIVALSERYDGSNEGRQALRAIDVELHSQIALHSGSERLYEAELEIQQDLSRVLASLPDIPLMHRSEGGEHDQLVAALAARDAAAAREAMIAHAEESLTWCLALLARGE